MAQLNTFITRQDGTSYDLNSLGIVTRDFIVSSPEYEHETYELEGRVGQVTTNTRIKARIIRVLFYMRAYDNGDFALARDRIFPIFRSNEPFYIADGRAKDRRWLVRQNGTFEMDQQGRYGFFEVEFIADYPYSKSVRKAGEVIAWDLDNSDWDAQIQWQQVPDVMTFTNSGTIHNRGTVLINPQEMDMTVTITGATANFSISNVTTGDIMRLNFTPGATTKIELKGSRVYVNGVLRPDLMTGDYITLAPGANKIAITGGGTGNKTVSFDFNYYYL